MINPYLPQEAEIVERIEEARDIFTLRLRFTDPAVHRAYSFAPGQFNMLWLPGVGEIPISIVSDPEDEHMYNHTIRGVGRVSNGLRTLRQGDRLGVRGPYGRGWPMQGAVGRDVVIATGGLGCAPAVSMINYVVRRREQFGRLIIMQGIKHSNDLIWRSSYEQWAELPDTQVLLAAGESGPQWPWAQGNIMVLIDRADFDPENCTAMLCGPQGMMVAVTDHLMARGVSDDDIWLSMERNMQCAIGHCGHCQIGAKFVCRDGPVFNYAEIADLLSEPGL
ncbi:Ni/Fe hydrogenase subunit gamma [Solemya pervernicosa gill symbiont]|uniref:Ni/Fe hydrogenase subunit gamma n=2 Tax=Gammaproteobacteria incertae sedis TaxID=118884 RepID=A0A1T2L530_9GAMM|nr:FAD/NAD(P)-binding protein [Candidatus Reidiella endopervernicosa]OOZ40215.1 Ni/Fe hydrogenase subunit gamma [Solemya pervernicosa gill symbiont]QKQ27129.1 FAD/NAD(P)-binding protein [Candidatus Reidiella endopervernicosa]